MKDLGGRPDDSRLSSLAAELRRLRGEIRMSQNALAVRLYVSPSSMSRYLAGKNRPPGTFIEELLKEVERARGAEVGAEERARLDRLVDEALQASLGPAARIEELIRQKQQVELRAQRAEDALAKAQLAVSRTRANGSEVLFRELVYMSETKLHQTMWPTSLYREKYSDSTSDVRVRLEDVVRWLSVISAEFDARSRLASSQWISFDLEMKLGSVHEDSGLVPDDIALFSGSIPTSGEFENRRSCLLLCGSKRNLLREVASAGRAGSGSEWLTGLVRELDRQERSVGTSVIPAHLPGLTSRDLRYAKAPRTAREVFGVHQHYALESGRLRGHARVIFDFDDASSLADRMVLATPLYVELVPRKRRRFARKITS